MIWRIFAILGGGPPPHLKIRVRDRAFSLLLRLSSKRYISLPLIYERKNEKMNKTRIVRWPEVKFMTGLSRVTVWRMEQKREFPARRILGGNSIGWIEEEITQWILQRRKVRDVQCVIIKASC